MNTYGITGVPQWATGANCDISSCGTHKCPDFIIKRHDTRPLFRVSVEDCVGSPSNDLSDDSVIVEVNMWSRAKLKTAITTTDTYFGLANNNGFDQIIIGDIIVMDRVRRPEQMLVLAFDESNKLIQVQRGYNGTEPSNWTRGSGMKIFRIKDGTASVNRVYEDVLNVDGTTTQDQMTGAHLVYEWQPNDTCVPGCYTLEFKLLQLATPSNINLLESNLGDIVMLNSDVPNFVSVVDFGCDIGMGVEWVRRFPSNKEGFTIQVLDSPTAE